MDVSEVPAADVEVEYASAADIRERAPRDSTWPARSPTGWNSPAQVWASAHEDVCPRHNLWIGNGVFAPEQQLDLTRTPDVIRAQRRYGRLRRR